MLWAYKRKDEEAMKKLKKLMMLLCLVCCFSAVGVSVFSEANTVYAAPEDKTGDETGDENGGGGGGTGNEDWEAGVQKFDDDESGGQKIKDMTKSVNPESNSLTDILGLPIQQFLNSLIYILLTVANLWFFLQTCMDLVFLLSPALRQALSKGDPAKKVKSGLRGVACGLVSEQALKACGCKREGEKGNKHINSNAFAEEVQWQAWVTGRLIMFVCILTYLALLMMGLLPTLVKFLSSFAYGVLKAIMSLFGFDPDDDNAVG